MKIFLWSFFTLTIIASEIEAVEVQCDFKDTPSYGHCCEVQNDLNFTSKDNRKVKSIGLTEKNFEVKFFYSYFKVFNFFPQNLASFLPNIETIGIIHGQIKEISSDDLKEFGEKLKNLWLAGNEIAIIRGNLFVHNPNLEYFEVAHNKIIHIDAKTFENLNNLRSLALNGNPCTNDNESESWAYQDRTEVLRIIPGIVSRCRDSMSVSSEDEDLLRKSNFEIENIKRQYELQIKEYIKNLCSKAVLTGRKEYKNCV